MKGLLKHNAKKSGKFRVYLRVFQISKFVFTFSNGYNSKTKNRTVWSAIQKKKKKKKSKKDAILRDINFIWE